MVRFWSYFELLQSGGSVHSRMQRSAPNEKKLIWIITVVLLALLGLILWFVLGPRDRKAWRLGD